jgi:GNAT superfamily N-acetyltransferase
MLASVNGLVMKSDMPHVRHRSALRVDDKHRVRLDIIKHVPGQGPYMDVSRETVKLPDREVANANLTDAFQFRFIPEIYRGLDAVSGRAFSKEDGINKGDLAMDPRDFWQERTLKNGLGITLRAVRPEDKARLLEAFQKLEPSTVYTRFFAPKKALSDAELEAATHLDFERSVALLATIGGGEGETVIGGGRYVADGKGGAEVAFTVEEDYQGLGIAGMILKELAGIARTKGLKRLEAEVLPANAPMLAVFRGSGLPMTSRMEDGVVHVVMTLA